jgi:RimJ/RimL family protein N-acetyltransferase
VLTVPELPLADPRPNDPPWAPLRWPPAADTVLTGSVVELRPVDVDDDVDELFTALDHDEVWRHVAGRPIDPAAYAATLRTHVAGGRLPWVVRLRVPHQGLVAGAIVGTSSYLDVAPADARLEIGWTAYTPAVWASGVNPDAKLTLLAYAFDELGAGRVQLKTDVRNQRSQRAIAGIGARFEGLLRRYQRRADGTIRDTVLFSILAEEWPTVRDHLQVRVSRAT